MPNTLSAQVAFAIYGSICLLILVLGGRYERVAGAALLIELVVGNITHDHVHGGPQYWLAGLDMGLLLVFGAVAVLSGKVWPLAAAGFQLVATIVHGIKAIDPSIHGWAYLSTNILFGWLALGAVLTGSILAYADRRRGRAPARWTAPSPPAPTFT